MFGLARIQAAHDSALPQRSQKSSPWKSIIDAFAACAVGQKRLPPTVKLQTPRIDQAPRIDVHVQIFGVELPHPAAFEAFGAEGGFDVAKNINRLVEIQISFWPPTKRMNKVVGIGGAKTVQNAAFFVGFSVAVGIGKVQNFGRVGHVNPAVARQNARGRNESFGKYR